MARQELREKESYDPVEEIWKKLEAFAHRHGYDPQTNRKSFYESVEKNRKAIDGLARRYGLDPQLEKTFFYFLCEVIWVTSITALDEKIISLGGLSSATEFFENEDLDEIFKGVSDFFYFTLNNEFKPLCSLGELAELTEDFLSHLEHNREDLLRTGLPRTMFIKSLWLEWHLSRLYPVKLPLETRYTVNSNGNIQYSYFWTSQSLEMSYFWPVDTLLRELYTPDGCLSLKRDAKDKKPATFVSYELAPPINGLEQEDADLLEQGRTKLFELKISILEELIRSVRFRNADRLWEKCVKLLTDKLMADDVDFYLQKDRFYRRPLEMLSDEPLFAVGGLTDLFKIIGYYEKEIRIGTLAKTRDELRDLVKHDSRNRPYLAVKHYFEVLARPERSVLDNALERFLSRDAEEQGFWQNYIRRVGEALENELYEDVVLREKIKRKHINKYKPEVTAYSKLVKASLEASANVSQDLLSQIGISLQPRDNLFRKKGHSWVIRYKGKEGFLLDDIKGLQYIALLLHRQGREISAFELEQEMKRKVPSKREDVYREMTEEQLVQDGLSISNLGDTGPALDTKAREDYKRRLKELEEGIEEAEKNNDIERLAKLKEEKEFLIQQLEAAFDLYGRDRKAASPFERSRVNVTKNIGKAFEKIEKDAPDLKKHFDKFLHRGTYCSYHPEEFVHWIL